MPKKSPHFKTVFLLLIFTLFFLVLLILPMKNSQVPSLVWKTSAKLSGVPFCTDHDPNMWHPPVKKDGMGKIICVYGHEHGDPSPAWVSQAGYSVGFDSMSGFMANTSDMENTAKHSAMKGFAATIQGVDVYLRIHLASNPLDRISRYHSYELFLKDQSGGVSHFQGWLNTGDPIADRIAYHDSNYGQVGIDPGRRPIVWAATRHACQVDHNWCFELWSMTTFSWGPNIIWGVNDPTTYFQPGEKYDMDITHWDLTGNLGGERTLVITLHRNPQLPVGKIWATQFGDIVSGPDDQKCFGRSIKYGFEYQNVCVENYISSTLPEISGLNNAAEKQFDLTGVQIPN